MTRLEKCIKESKLTQKEVADQAGVSKSTIHALLWQDKGYGQRSLMKLSKLFNVNPEWLCGESNTRTGYGGK